MCGIVGIISRSASLDLEVLRCATASLAHRGPDDSGSVVLRPQGSEPLEIGLGHRRLSILDLSPLGHQPMHHPQTGNWIVFNGEIYNFREIRAELELKGFTFRSRSDTEVLLNAYALWGEDCLQYLRGIFAFAIWDAKSSSLFLARDQMGVKPLYYCEQNGYFVFASEIRTLLGTGLVQRKLNSNGLATFLSFGSVYDPQTAIEGVLALEAGHCLVWQSGRFSTKRYWNVPAIASPGTKDIQDQVSRAVGQSVRMQTVSDVPVGVFLSGGIDSSAITAVLSRAQRPTTFSVVFREQEYNEADSSRLIAQRFKTDHREILCPAEDGLALSNEAIHAMDQPTIDGLNTYLICKTARKAGIKVVLSGLGGDELFCGYRSFRSVPRMEQLLRFWNRVPRRTGVAGLVFGGLASSDSRRKLHALAAENGNLIHPYFLSRALFTPAQSRQLIRGGGLNDAQSPLRQALAETAEMDPINRVSYLESRCYMLNTLLRDADVMSMAHGLELRVPLIDHRLAETLFSIPGRQKLSRTTPKPLLVGAVRSELPEQIIHRKKQGFTFPFEHWLRNQMRAEIERSIARIADGPLSGAVSPEAALQVWNDFQHGRTSWSRPWSLHVLQRWCERNEVFADN
ncbi:MAG TPA: asparagine synthase (glutamine-hydrolyzing) [Terriglobales bacterium]|jgi:asparagine synthase (glutamine-hydrolysing)|nr:asparagine synthase (glutamine-hydrolyzing) [Terriglobales bacterium]